MLKVHTSNYRIAGFTKEVGAREPVALTRERGVPLVHDLGSGTLVDLAGWGLAHEPTVAETIADGADIVTFSGDKLLGGPQPPADCRPRSGVCFSADPFSAGCAIIAPPAGRHPRRTDAHAIENPGRALAALFECAAGHVDLTAFARDHALSADEVERLAEQLGLIRIPVQRTCVALSPARWMQLKRGILDKLTTFHADNPDLPGHRTGAAAALDRAALAGAGLCRGVAGSGAGQGGCARRRLGSAARP